MRRLYWLAAALLLIAAGCGGDGDTPSGQPMPEMVREAAKWPPGAVPTSERVIQHTPAGAVHTGELPLTISQLSLIDEGITALNDAMVLDGFRPEVLKPHSFYRISTPKQPCVPSPEARVPSFVVNGGIYYDGTEWDQYNTKGRLATPQMRNDGAMLYFVPDGTSVVFAPELVLSTGNYPGATQGWMYVCPDASVLVNAVRHGGDHIAASNLIYSEANRIEPPYDGGTYANCSVFHGAGIVHPLFPRNGRCYSGAIAEPKAPTDAELGIGKAAELEGRSFVTGRFYPVK